VADVRRREQRISKAKDKEMMFCWEWRQYYHMCDM